jgi:Mrp family chromosome partitioning ATPase
MLAVTMNRMGYHTAILGTDITGQSIRRHSGLRKNSGSNSAFTL